MHRPDVVLMDMSMPDMDGLTCLRHLREEDATHDLPVVLVTAADEAAAHDAAADLNVTGYLLKSDLSFERIKTALNEAA